MYISYAEQKKSTIKFNSLYAEVSIGKTLDPKIVILLALPAVCEWDGKRHSTWLPVIQ